MKKRIIAGFLAFLLAVQPAMAAFPFHAGETINAADINNALQTAAITSGSIDSVNITNSVIRSSIGTFTSLTSPSVSLTGGLLDNIGIGRATPLDGTFTTLSATSLVSGAGFATYLASPPAIGGTAPAAGTFTGVTVTGGGVTAASGTVAASAVTVTNGVTAGSFGGAGTGLTGTAASLNIGGNAGTASAVNNTATSKLPSLTATVAANALTINASSVYLDFRSATSASGIPSTVLAAPAALVVPASAVLGTIAGNAEHLMVLELNNVGTAELAVVNLSGGVDLDEEDVISTTAISVGSSASNVVYSTTSRTNVPYRVVGALEITEATPGAWATAPSNIAGVGAGNAYMSLHSFGYGQNWQDVTASRTSGTPYYNQTIRPIEAMLTVGGANTITVSVNGVTLTTGHATNVDFTVQPGQTYTGTSTSGSFTNWAELR